MGQLRWQSGNVAVLKTEGSLTGELVQLQHAASWQGDGTGKRARLETGAPRVSGCEIETRPCRLSRYKPNGKAPVSKTDSSPIRGVRVQVPVSALWQHGPMVSQRIANPSSVKTGVPVRVRVLSLMSL